MNRTFFFEFRGLGGEGGNAENMPWGRQAKYLFFEKKEKIVKPVRSKKHGFLRCCSKASSCSKASIYQTADSK